MKMHRIVSSLLKLGREENVFSGAQAAWSLDGHTIEHCFWGTESYESNVPIISTTLFDIASISKVFCGSALLRLVDRDQLDLNIGYSAQCRMVPPGAQTWLDATLAQFLAHESGAPHWKPFYESIPMASRGCEEAKQEILSMIFREDSVYPTGSKAVYSDLGFILLGYLLEQRLCESLENVIRREVIEPLGLERAQFRPINGKETSSGSAFAATEVCPWRNRELRGEVHDDNAWTMGGVAGHAGVFATATDLVKLGLGWRRSLKQGGWISKTTARSAVTRRPSGRGLCFDLKSETGSSVGSSASHFTFGHLGFTGCSLWVDPVRDAVVVLLTNRVHPSRQNDKIKQFRPIFHDRFFKGE